MMAPIGIQVSNFKRLMSTSEYIEDLTLIVISHKFNRENEGFHKFHTK